MFGNLAPLRSKCILNLEVDVLYLIAVSGQLSFAGLIKLLLYSLMPRLSLYLFVQLVTKKNMDSFSFMTALSTDAVSFDFQFEQTLHISFFIVLLFSLRPNMSLFLFLILVYRRCMIKVNLRLWLSTLCKHNELNCITRSLPNF